MYYAHKEFTPENLPLRYSSIPLSAYLEYHEPSEIMNYDIQRNKSIDIHLDGRTITFVSDELFPNSSSFLLMVSSLTFLMIRS